MPSVRVGGVVMSLVVLGTATGWPQGYAPRDAAGKMAPADGLRVQLYAAEPEVRQPILVKFDDRGRLWTIQYLQYPNPAGLKRVAVDRFSRTTYDRVPEPPPKGPRGDDRITLYADPQRTGRATVFKDFVTGLNLCTGLEFGADGVFVLQAPYLLYYPDRNRDDVPDSDPEVLLSGFGIEDAQSMVNHLTWGPDGWLYGVTGSTATNRVRGIEFQQAVWRYHPETKQFELFCEGGGNLFGLTFDADGNLFASSNGTWFALHAVQGAYYRKNFGKHGPLHNPFAYGFFEHISYDRAVSGPTPGGTIYLGDTLPERFRGAWLCCEFLQHRAAWWNLVPHGATFRAKFGGTLLDSRDTWFCAPDLCQGPDGAVYLCDFHDQRTAHPDPDANWDRSNGRIYRLFAPGTKPVQGLDLAKKTSAELVKLLDHPNGWYHTRARVHLAARRDAAVAPALRAMARQSDSPQRALQGLWALHGMGGFDEALAAELLNHPAPAVRAWTIRLLGDPGKVAPALAQSLHALARSEPSVNVRCQLAATARRLPGADGLPIVEELLRRGGDVDDPFLPLMLWWAVEEKSLTDHDRLFAFFGTESSWQSGPIRENALRLIRRYAAEGTRAGYDACARLLQAAPKAHVAAALAALDQGLAERSVGLGGMGLVGIFDRQAARNTDDKSERRYEPLSGELARFIERRWREAPRDLTRLKLALRDRQPDAVAGTVRQLSEPATPPERRVALVKLCAELGIRRAVPPALQLLDGSQPVAVQTAVLDLLGRAADDTVGQTLLDWYAKSPAALRPRVRAILLSRPASARAFLQRVAEKKISAAEVALDELRPVALHGDAALDSLVRKLWGNIAAGTPEEKLAEIRRIGNDLRAGAGNRTRGKELFRKHCANCHKLFGEGEGIGPDLTGVSRNDRVALLTSIVDPSAVIRSEYLQYAVVTQAGQIHTGLIANQDGGSITLVDAKGERRKIDREDVAELRELPTSLMPEKLLEPLKPQELRDLFAYLQGSAP